MLVSAVCLPSTLWWSTNDTSKFYPPLILCVCVCVCVSVCVCAKSFRLCLTLCDLMVYSPPGSFVHEVFQARILEWLSCPPPGDLLTQGGNPVSLPSPALAGVFLTISATWEAPVSTKTSQIQLKYAWVHLYYSCWLYLACLLLRLFDSYSGLDSVKSSPPLPFMSFLDLRMRLYLESVPLQM